MLRDLYLGLATHTPIRAHLKDGTSNCLRQKGPILSDVMQTCSHFTDRGPFSNPANLKSLKSFCLSQPFHTLYKPTARYTTLLSSALLA